MFQQPSHRPNAIAGIAKWALVALLVLSALSAIQQTRVELRCGAACQQLVTGREY